jgi:hypothetical protein
VIVSQDALERFERQVARVRGRLQEARRRGMPVPSDAALDDFIARNRLTILRGLTELLARREAPIDPGQPDAWTESRRTAANLEAMQLLVSKPPGRIPSRSAACSRATAGGAACRSTRRRPHSRRRCRSTRAT